MSPTPKMVAAGTEVAQRMIGCDGILGATLVNAIYDAMCGAIVASDAQSSSTQLKEVIDETVGNIDSAIEKLERVRSRVAWHGQKYQAASAPM